jgi:murein DD-endopeptidase MepM/ murein hydrolase activator NlpD
MLRTQRIRGLRACGSRAASRVVLFLAVAAGGCSADLARFDFPSSNYGPDGRSTAALQPTPSEPLRRSNAGAPLGDDIDNPRPWDRGEPSSRGSVYGSEPQGREYRPDDRSSYRGPSQGQDTRMAALPPPRDQAADSKYNYRREPELREPQQRATPAYKPSSAYQPSPQRAEPAMNMSPASGAVIEVKQGDTLTSIAKQHRVSVAELMSVNNLQSPVLRPGQQLALPAGKRVVTQRIPVTTQAPVQTQREAAVEERPRHASAPSPVVATTGAGSDWQGVHTIASGESLYGIARKYNVKVAELQEVNGIASVTRIRPGTVIKVPGNGAATSKTIAAAPSRSEMTPISGGSPIKPRIINGDSGGETAEPKRVASLGPSAQTATDASSGEAQPKSEAATAPAERPKLTGGSGKFRWPVKGRIISNFGVRPDKSHNDGVDISVPQGTEVMAAEGGVVAYSGNELKGYGNLILIRHDGGWVSAYGNNDELLVKRGDKVKRGQTIAKAGNTGAVDRPQLHFELRQDSKPVDPLPHMEKQ